MSIHAVPGVLVEEFNLTRAGEALDYVAGRYQILTVVNVNREAGTGARTELIRNVR
jgi:hypothetical protein